MYEFVGKSSPFLVIAVITLMEGGRVTILLLSEYTTEYKLSYTTIKIKLLNLLLACFQF